MRTRISFPSQIALAMLLVAIPCSVATTHQLSAQVAQNTLQLDQEIPAASQPVQVAPNEPTVNGPVAEIAEAPSPSDVASDSNAEASQDESAQSTDTRPIEPFKSRGLEVRSLAINVSTEGVGNGKTPDSEQSLGDDAIPLPVGFSRMSVSKMVHWNAAQVTHNPLYYEDPMLERHGHSRWGYFEPFASAARFYSKLAIKPYLIALQHPHDCVYALGDYRPGSCAPVLKSHLPYDYHAAVTQGVSSGLYFWAMPY